MVGPSESEKVLHVLLNVRAAKGVAGMVRDYDLLFTDNGILFINTAGGFKTLMKSSVGAQFGAVGAVLVRSSIEKDKQKGRNELEGLDLRQMLEQNEKSFYIPYMEVHLVTLKKGLTGIGKMSIQTSDGKYNCEFPKNQIEPARAAVSEKLSAKMEG
jgi:hypothetical protein